MRIIKGLLFLLLPLWVVMASLKQETRPTSSGIMINIQPFKDLPDSCVNYVVKRLKTIYPNITLKTAIPISKQAYYKPRNRYRADSLIRILGRTTPAGEVTIGITSKDISDTKDQYPDWGVMGLGFCPGNACVVSTYRLSKKNLLDQLFKVAIHELGHTQGLPHCPVKYCFMQDAEGKNSTDSETDFCPKCKALLRSKGWKIE